MTSSIRNKIAIILFLIGFALAMWGVNYPFVGIYNTNNNYLSLAAKNYLRFGFVQLRFLPTYFAGEHFMPGDPYYLHHPILVFLTEAVSLFLFGARNWAVHVPQLLFVVGSIFMIYKLGSSLWNKRVGLWAAAIAAVFPMTTFFWKYMQFEQASLLLNLLIVYMIVRNKNFWWIFVVTLLSGFADWGVLYLAPFFLVLFYLKHKNMTVRTLVAYFLGVGISLGIFGIGVYFLQNGLKELGTAIWGRSYTAELTSLSFWPIRLILISLLRMVLYFTPVSFAALWIVYKRKDTTLLLFFLPAASWGHSYFLYYFIPFFAFSGGIFMDRIGKKSEILAFWLILILITSVGVNYLKIQQVKKQLWKFDVAVAVNHVLKPYETVGVVNFAGDVFENYFLHPSQPIVFGKLDDWLTGVAFPGVDKAVYVCSGMCTTGESAKAESLSGAGLAVTYKAGTNNAWLITKRIHAPIPVTKTVIPASSAAIDEENIFIKIYRGIRDTLSVGQI
jgi:hypothetical protein